MIFEQLKSLVLYCVAHAALILIVTEAAKKTAEAFGRPMVKQIKILVPFALGVSSFFVGPFVVRSLDLVGTVCADVADCGQETAWVVVLWWGASSCGSIGLYHLIPLFSSDLVELIRRKIQRQ